MEKWRTIVKEKISFNVSNQGGIQVLGSDRGKLIKTLKSKEQFGQKGGHPNNRYLCTHGFYVHRLVVETWIGPIEKGLEVNHISGNKFDNSVDNLEIVTSSANKEHRWLLESMKNVPKSVLIHENTWGIYDKEFNLLETYKRKEEAAKSIKVSRQAVHKSFLKARPIHKKFYVCRPTQLNDLKTRVESLSGGNKKCLI